MAFKTNEIPMLSELLGQFDISRDSITTVDALHTQRATIEHIVGRGGHVVMTAKKNQPTLYGELKALLWKGIERTSDVDRSRGRRVRRTIKAAEVPAGVAGGTAPLRLTRGVEWFRPSVLNRPGISGNVLM